MVANLVNILKPRLERIYKTSPLLRASIWYILARFFSKVLVFGATFIFTHLLTTDQYGTISIFSTWLSLFSVILTLNIDACLPRAFHDFPADDYKDFTISVVILGLLLVLTAALIALILAPRIHQNLFGLDKPLVLLAVVTSLFMIPFRVQARLWQTTNDYKKRTITEFLAEASTILLSIALIVIPGFFITDYDRALGRIVGASLVFIVIGSLFLINMLRSYKFAINFSYWKYALVFSIPVLPHIIGDQLLAQFDRVMIDNTIGRSEAGLYSFAYNIGNIVTWIYGGFAVGWMPWVFERMEKQDTDTIILRMRQIMIAFAGLVVLLMLVLPLTIPWISGPAYAPSIPIIPIVVASGFFYVLTGLFGIIEWYEKKTVYTSLGTILATVINIALNYVFIPRMGYTVAAWTTLISYILLAVVHYYISQKLIGFHLDKNLRIILLLSLIVIATVILLSYFLSM